MHGVKSKLSDYLPWLYEKTRKLEHPDWHRGWWPLYRLQGELTKSTVKHFLWGKCSFGSCKQFGTFWVLELILQQRKTTSRNNSTSEEKTQEIMVWLWVSDCFWLFCSMQSYLEIMVKPQLSWALWLTTDVNTETPKWKSFCDRMLLLV